MASAAASVDCDVRVPAPPVAALEPYLSAHWREYARVSAFPGPFGPGHVHPDDPARGAEAIDVAAWLEAWREAIGTPWDVRNAVLNCYYGVEAFRNPDFSAAMAAAVNDWIAAEWLARDPSLLAGIVVPVGYPELAAREIDRVGGHDQFVQVLMPVRSEHPYGSRLHEPLLDAAARQGLALALHVGGVPGTAPTPNGWPTYYVEQYVGMTHVFQSQLTSLVVEGVFDRRPELHVVLLESGVSWIPSTMWRLTKDWKGLRRETPWVHKAPWDCIREHVRATIAPLDLPADGGQLDTVLEQIGSDEVLLFGSDYPGHDGADLSAAWEALTPDRRERIWRENAIGLYRLPARA
jgi:predicted TIM-barrel fold metal-dependent hydrolase